MDLEHRIAQHDHEYGQPCSCHPVAAPGSKSQRVIRTAASSCCTVGRAGMEQLKAMDVSEGSADLRGA
jgi:hypothetical protein